jgi:hypothetical protein
VRVRRTVVIALLGSLLLAPLMLAHAQAESASYGHWHQRQLHYGPSSSNCGNPIFDFWYGYYYYPGCRCLYHGWWRTCTVGDVTP